MGAGVELAWERSRALPGPSGHLLPALPLPDLQRGETQDTQPQIPQVSDTGECWEGFPLMPMGLLGAGVWDTWAHQPFNPSPQQPPGRPDYLPMSLSPSGFHPFPGSPFSSPAQIPSLGSSANGAGNLDPLPPSLALLIGSGAFSSGKAVIRGWIPTDREQPPHSHPPSPF